VVHNPPETGHTAEEAAKVACHDVATAFAVSEEDGGEMTGFLEPEAYRRIPVRQKWSSNLPQKEVDEDFVFGRYERDLRIIMRV
jgi:hypothetical protein